MERKASKANGASSANVANQDATESMERSGTPASECPTWTSVWLATSTWTSPTPSSPSTKKSATTGSSSATSKSHPSGGGGGAGGAAGGGGSIIIYPKPDGGAPPTNDNDGKPIDKGDIWLDTNSGWLWVYNGSVWLPVGDRPPVSISPNPPLWNSTGDTDNRYPIVAGSLWFDSDQLALYVAAKDSANNMVWVITIPADRSVLLSEVPVNPFVFPASATGTYANDGDTVYNTTTELWYIYNGKKNQWIDLPPGRQELSLQAILLRGADNFPTTFEYEPADRITYDTDALCYVNEDDHPDFTRIVVPFVDTAGFDWTFLLRGIRKGDQLSLIQIDAVDPLDPDDDFPFRSDFLTISDITENADSINVDIEYQQENPVHLPYSAKTSRFASKQSSTSATAKFITKAMHQT